jgi:hypothetical protein
MVLRMRAVDIVEDAGFTAIEAVNADEAISILEARSDISLLFVNRHWNGTPYRHPKGALTRFWCSSVYSAPISLA